MPTVSGVDCHAHVIAPSRFPYAAGPGYKPRPDEIGEAPAYRRVLAAHGISHALLVQPSCYGYDNACMLEAIAQSDNRWRGVAMVAPSASERELVTLREHGVVGVRLHLMLTDPAALSRPDVHDFLGHVQAVGMFVQVYAQGDVWVNAVPILCTNRARIVVDHFGEPDAARGVDQPGFQAILQLARETDAVVKLSAAFRSSREPYPHADVEPFIGAALEAFGVPRCVWGSDWPFINTTQRVEYGNLRALLARWLPSAEDQESVLCRNPAALCGFLDT